MQIGPKKHHCNKLVQIRCQKGACTKMHKCLIRYVKFSKNKLKSFKNNEPIILYAILYVFINKFDTFYSTYMCYKNKSVFVLL